MDLSTRTGRKEQGQRLQRAVERAGLSIEDLAGRIGCSRALIYQYLSGTTLAQPDRLQQIARECGVTLGYFYADSADESAAQSGGASAPPSAPEVAARLRESLRTLEELADALEAPPDYRSLASTCERIVSLASQLGDATGISTAQKRLGTAWLRLADYPRAADALARAVTLSIESGDVSGETAARQSLGNALLAMGRDGEAREQFQRIAGGSVFSGRWQGTLSLGAIHELHGQYREAMERFDEAAAILEDAAASGTARPETVAIGTLYVNANRANVYMDGGDFGTAKSIAERCLEDAEAIGNADQHLEARFNIGWCDFYTGSWAQACRAFGSMLQLARFVGDQGRQTLARAWMGILKAAAGDFEAAIEHGKDALALALSHGDRRSELYAHLALADAYMGYGDRPSEARYHASQAMAVATSQRQDRHEIECRLRFARLASQTGDGDELRDSAARALTLAGRLGARHLEALARCWHAAGLLLPGGVASGEAPAMPARAEAEAALRVSTEIGLSEVIWRANAVIAAACAAASDDDCLERHTRASIAELERVRHDLMDAGLGDTMLESGEYLEVYERLGELLRLNGRSDELATYLDQTAWPPLTERLERRDGAART